MTFLGDLLDVAFIALVINPFTLAYVWHFVKDN